LTLWQYFVMLYCSIVLHYVDLPLRSTFSIYIDVFLSLYEYIYEVGQLCTQVGSLEGVGYDLWIQHPFPPIHFMGDTDPASKM
jgi:hypothetical protein